MEHKGQGGKVRFDSDSHRYLDDDGRIVPGVTQVLTAMGLRSDLSTIAPDVLEFARQRGTAVHDACLFVDTNSLDESSLDPRIAPYVEAWRSFVEDHGFELIDAEAFVMSKTWRFAGRVDRVGWIGHHRAIVDIKTGQWDPSTPLQCAAYADAWEEMTGDHIDGSWTVELKDNGGFRLVDNRTKEPRARELWRAAVTLFHWRADNGRAY